jgi:hypothetical protein
LGCHRREDGVKIITHDDEGFVIDQGTEKWKALRVGLFTGTGIGDLLPGARGGANKARQDQIDEVVTELLTGLPSGGFFATKYVREGIQREPFARMAYQELTGHVIEEVAFIQHDWLRAGMSPDGLVYGRKWNVEIKCPKDRTHMRYLQLDECPIEYKAQVQTQLWLGEFELCKFISWHPHFPEAMRLKVITVQRDEAYIKQIEEEVTKAHAEVNLLLKKIKSSF